MSAIRPYIVTDKAGDTRLVQASNQAQALRHAAINQFTVRAATANEVIELMTSGVQPEVASQDAATQDKEQPEC